MVADVITAFGRIDIVVNCASVFYRKPIEELTEQDWDINLDTNLKAPFFLSKFAGAAMRRQGAGKIVNIGDGPEFVLTTTTCRTRSRNRD